MKRYFIVIFLFVLGIQCAFAQNKTDEETEKNGALQRK